MKLKTDFPEEFFREEERSIVISEDKKRLWAVLLDLLVEFDRVCKHNNISYMLDAGTLLGAVRHGGMIPWDDDIDVVMLRSDYEKLCSVAEKEFSEPYFWQTYKTDKDHGRGFARLRNSETTYMPRFEMNGKYSCYSHNQGVLIDVFVCDNIPDDEQERNSFLKSLSKFQHIAWSLRKSKMSKWSFRLLFKPPELFRKLCYEICRICRIDVVNYYLGKLDVTAQRYNACSTNCVSRLTFCTNKASHLFAMIPRYFFDELTEAGFEGWKFPITKHWNEYLTMFYGDWRKHVIASNTPGGIFIDLENSYKKYIDSSSI